MNVMIGFDNNRLCIGHDEHDNRSQHHDDALKKIHRMTDIDIKCWLVLDNEYDDIDIELKHLNLNSHDIDEHDNMPIVDMIPDLSGDARVNDTSAKSPP